MDQQQTSQPASQNKTALMLFGQGFGTALLLIVILYFVSPFAIVLLKELLGALVIFLVTLLVSAIRHYKLGHGYTGSILTSAVIYIPLSLMLLGGSLYSIPSILILNSLPIIIGGFIGQKLSKRH